MLSTHSFVMTSGERYVTILDTYTGVPHYATSLFLTTQLRNADVAHATVLNAAGHLILLYRYLAAAEIDLLHRIHSSLFFQPHELDSLRDFCSMRHRRRESVLGRTSARASHKKDSIVNRKTLYARLTTIANYIEWFAHQQFDYSKPPPPGLAEVVTQIRARRPTSKGRNQRIDKGLSAFQLQALLEALDVNNKSNPFTEPLRERNRLMVLLEHELGIRAGELLNLRIEDFDFSTNIISIVRRADQRDDPRDRQPLVKTCSRSLPVSLELMTDVHRYITGKRRSVPNARRSPYLFVTHKQGPTSGQPLSIAGYQKVWATLRKSSLTLADSRGHRLRHTWNQYFSEAMDALPKPPSEHEQELMRSRLMGWKEGSGTARHYNQRFIAAKADAASLKLQSQLRTPRGRDDES